MDNKRIESMNKSFMATLEQEASKHKDIKILLDDWKSLTNQGSWSKDFLDGYLASISDLILIKKMM